MNHQAFLVVCYILGSRYHSGQCSKGYALLCMAQTRAAREHSAWNVGRTVEQLDNHRLYKQGGKFRNQVAAILWRMRKHRHSL